ncbi:hypothetical protein BDV96DRAFT_357450 [Lophiotrema nucula]|uniref:Uncharacterized protein n=1 Tax=Lophiotrema nucula TaxID=690887 RepID=A0A6A5YHW1_9PLEO|nr:hypothetical protein BDV96DRAFT_357450 [Lophiotrema nucula]
MSYRQGFLKRINESGRAHNLPESLDSRFHRAHSSTRRKDTCIGGLESTRLQHIKGPQHLLTLIK